MRSKSMLSLLVAAAAVGLVVTGAALAQQAAPRPTVGPVGVAPRIQPDAKAKQVIQQRAALAAGVTPVTDAMLLSPNPEDWLMWRRTYNAHGYSPLKDINRDNVRTLSSAWAWSLPANTTQVTPLVHDGIIYVNTAGDHVQALDGTNGELLWEYSRDPTPGSSRPGQASVHRAFAIYGDKLFLGTDDKHEVALDVKTGKVVWDHAFPDGKDWRITAGPLVVKGKVIQAMVGCAAGGCPVVALDANTGNELWRFYTVAKSDQPGGNSWNGLPDDQRFGGSVWTTPSYDPELNLIYVATGNTYHWQELMKGGAGKKPPGTNRDGLYVDSTIALNADTGKLKWYYQHLPQDYWDLDFAFEQTIATIDVKGKPVKAVCSTGKMVWTDCVDAATGKFLLSHDAGLQNIVKSFDPKTGRKTYFDQAIPDLSGQRRDLQCSAGYGDKNWPAGSYDAATNIDYSSLTEVCGESAPTMFGPNTSAYVGGQEVRMARYQPGTDGNIGRLDAVNWSTQKIIWSVRQRASLTSATVATAGGVIFAGDSDRWFKAFDQKDGKVLWQTRLNDVINTYPITYGVKGKQYVAVVAGCCGNGRLNNMHQLTPEIEAPHPGGSVLWVFALPDAVKP
ncbi:MAG TPA: PQQ-binding-like beta-propeller repeat protein [Rhizomicrobium sp.]